MSDKPISAFDDGPLKGAPIAGDEPPVLYGNETSAGWLVFAAMFFIALAAAAICSLFTGPSPTTMMGVPVIGFTIWVCTLAGFWMAFGTQYWRFLVAVCPPLCALFLNWISGGGELTELLCFFVGITAVVAMTGAVLRAMYGQLRRDFDAKARDALQFDLRHLFILMTTVAALVGVGRALYAANFWNPFNNVAVIIAVLVAAISLMTVITIWALFGRELTVVRMLLLGVSMLGAAASTGLVIDQSSRLFWVSVILFEQALIIGALICIRVQRYRFVKV